MDADSFKDEWALLKVKASTTCKDLAECDTFALLISKLASSEIHLNDFPLFIKVADYLLTIPQSTAGEPQTGMFFLRTTLITQWFVL